MSSAAVVTGALWVNQICVSHKIVVSLPKQSQDLDLSCKMDLDFWNCLGRTVPSYNAIKTCFGISALG